MARMIRIGVALALSLSASPQSQMASHEPAFEVASVKPSLHGPIYAQSDPSRLTINAQSLEVLIQMAYGLREYQYSGPSWLHTTRYDIAGTTGSPQPYSVQLAMLRTLLADRFRSRQMERSRPQR